MKITSIEIENLFELYNYKISLINPENLLVITGPNGFGKTTILNIIFNLEAQNFLYFWKLLFDKITIHLENTYSICLTRTQTYNKIRINIEVFEGENSLESFEYPQDLDANTLEDFIGKYLPVQRIGESRWIDLHRNRIFNTDQFVGYYGWALPENIQDKIFFKNDGKVFSILESIKIHFIKEQRLLRIVEKEDNDKDQKAFDPRVQDLKKVKESIQFFSDSLKSLIEDFQYVYLQDSQQLDSNFPDRLMKEKRKLTEEDFNRLTQKTRKKQETLAKYGLYNTYLQVTQYIAEDSKTILIYLEDLEKKLQVFDPLIERLELFTETLNKRRLTYKSIHVGPQRGFYFKTDNGKEIALSQLSSGEKHEVVILYELIFNTDQNTLVLIDEPEISLHITWQKEFIKDLLKIIKLQKIQVIVATHSPSIVNDRWDLVYSLEKID